MERCKVCGWLVGHGHIRGTEAQSNDSPCPVPELEALQAEALTAIAAERDGLIERNALRARVAEQEARLAVVGDVVRGLRVGLRADLRAELAGDLAAMEAASIAPTATAQPWFTMHSDGEIAPDIKPTVPDWHKRMEAAGCVRRKVVVDRPGSIVRWLHNEVVVVSERWDNGWAQWCQGVLLWTTEEDACLAYLASISVPYDR